MFEKKELKEFKKFLKNNVFKSKGYMVCVSFYAEEGREFKNRCFLNNWGNNHVDTALINYKQLLDERLKQNNSEAI